MNSSSGINTSSHFPVSAIMSCNLPTECDKPNKSNPGLPPMNWAKCDISTYRNIVSDLVHSLPCVSPQDDFSSSIAWCDSLSDILHHAATSSSPTIGARRSKAWDGNVSRAMAQSKIAMRTWNEAGRPEDGPIHEARKLAKRTLHQSLRQADAEARSRIYIDIMSAAQNNTKLFHKLINHQRKTPNTDCHELIENGILHSNLDDVLDLWTKHFTKLATPQENPEFDETTKVLVDESILLIEAKLYRYPEIPAEISRGEVFDAIRALNLGRAKDIHGIKAEHLHHADLEVLDPLVNLFNSILRQGRSPDQLLSAYVLPIHKKGKDRLCKDNYRGITITPTISKTLEHVILKRIEPNLHQNDLQYGFTKRSSPCLAILLVTETIAQALDKKDPLYIMTLDVRKAFDVVSHNSLMRKLYNQTDGPTWSALHHGLQTQSRVSLQGQLGDRFTVLQGVGQGRILSTHNYKTYINDLLDELTCTHSGTEIGDVYTGAPTCADDVVLMANNTLDLQIQADIVSSYARRERYQIHPDKSHLVTFNLKHPVPIIIAGKEVSPSEQAIHLGIPRHSNTLSPDTIVKERLSCGRKTAYSLMGTGFHGVNGLSPKISLHIYEMYVLPRVLYGLEATILKKKHLSELESFHRGILRDLQSLPTRCSTSAIHLLSGQLPIEAILDTRMATLLHMVGRDNTSTLAHIALHQLSSNTTSSRSWFVYCAQRLSRYNIDPLLIISNKLSTTTIKATIRDYHSRIIRLDAASKSSLKYLHLSDLEMTIRHPHPVRLVLLQ